MYIARLTTDMRQLSFLIKYSVIAVIVISFQLTMRVEHNEMKRNW